jgi:hypothetical protein
LLYRDNVCMGDRFMTVTHPAGAAPVQRSHLSAALVDGITEVVALPPDPSSRAAAIAGLVQEIYETLSWLNTSTAYRQELASFARVVAEVRQHEDRMNALARVATAQTGVITSQDFDSRVTAGRAGGDLRRPSRAHGRHRTG